MKTMLDKIGIIGDVKTAFNRLGIDTLAVVCVGGSSGTAVKVVTCDTVGGDYTDFLTLKADAMNINEGFCFSLIGAKKFVKITGCDNAIGIVGDCDYDVKKVTFNTITIAGADLENNKAQTINVSTYTEPVEVTPTQGKDGMKKATVTLSNIPSGATPSTDYPSWWVEGDELNSIVPNGVECVAVDEQGHIIVGDGVSSLGDLLSEFGTLFFSRFCASYGDSVVFTFYTDK